MPITKMLSNIPPDNRPSLVVEGATTHNLKGVDCAIPHGALTVVTGLSGAGKSSLAVDTVYAEAQRRFVESMSTYARQFLQQMERPPADRIEGVLPPILLTPKVSIQNARSTVGTLSEIYEPLRLLFAHLGQVDCPNGHGRLREWAAESLLNALQESIAGDRFTLCAEVERPAKDADRALEELTRLGYRRIWRDDAVVELPAGAGWPKKLVPLRLVIGRLAKTSDRERLDDAVEEALRLGQGRVQIFGDKTLIVSTGSSAGRTCIECCQQQPLPTPDLFSFYSPLGACPECGGFGRVAGIDPDLVIPDPALTLEENPFAPWKTPRHSKNLAKLLAAAKECGIPTDVPWSILTESQHQWVWSGSGPFVSLDKFFARLERKKYRVHARVFLARFRSYNRCSQCDGERLADPGREYRVAERRLPELTSIPLVELLDWLRAQSWDQRDFDRVSNLLQDLDRRLATMVEVGLGYLHLNRRARTLSGGEIQRVQMAAALGSGLTSTLYVIDEPTVGLHAADSARLLKVLGDLTAKGNTVLVVEHDPALILGADHVIDLGPGSGEHGGVILAAGTVDHILANPESVTGRFLAREGGRAWREHSSRHRRESGYRRKGRRSSQPEIVVRGANANNLRDLTVRFPVGMMTGVAGASGSGKSTLIADTLHGQAARHFGTAAEAGSCDGVDGLQWVHGVELVDQRPAGRSSRSNPVTYIKAYDGIRRLFAATPRARELEIGPGAFSFNIDGGRCPSCKGTGSTEVDMQFMAPISVTCDQCSGRRFQQRVLDVRCRGRNIIEVLQMTVDEALLLFADAKGVANRLRLLSTAGLGYLRLGQATSTLSGGEVQRLKLASMLGPKDEQPRLLIFDEPTTGLHLADIDVLVTTLRRLTERGHTVVVVEHSLEFLLSVDWLVDLGPGGGPDGGQLLYQGPLEPYLKPGPRKSQRGGRCESPTAELLRRLDGAAAPDSTAEDGAAEGGAVTVGTAK